MILNDLERKLVTVIQHHNKRGSSISLSELEIRIGHNSSELKKVINDLIKRNWIAVQDGEWIVKRKLF